MSAQPVYAEPHLGPVPPGPVDTAEIGHSPWATPLALVYPPACGVAATPAFDRALNDLASPLLPDLPALAKGVLCLCAYQETLPDDPIDPAKGAVNAQVWRKASIGWNAWSRRTRLTGFAEAAHRAQWDWLNREAISRWALALAAFQPQSRPGVAQLAFTANPVQVVGSLADHWVNHLKATHDDAFAAVTREKCSDVGIVFGWQFEGDELRFVSAPFGFIAVQMGYALQQTSAPVFKAIYQALSLVKALLRPFALPHEWAECLGRDFQFCWRLELLDCLRGDGVDLASDAAIEDAISDGEYEFDSVEEVRWVMDVDSRLTDLEAFSEVALRVTEYPEFESAIQRFKAVASEYDAAPASAMLHKIATTLETFYPDAAHFTRQKALLDRLHSTWGMTDMQSPITLEGFEEVAEEVIQPHYEMYMQGDGEDETPDLTPFSPEEQTLIARFAGAGSALLTDLAQY